MIGSNGSSKCKSYGFKASVTAVHNDGKYDLNFQFDDVNGIKLDKNMSGKVDELEQDISLAILELYLDIMKKDKTQNAVESSSPQSTPETEERRTSKPVFEPDTKDDILSRQDSLDDMFGKIMNDFAKEMQDKHNRERKRGKVENGCYNKSTGTVRRPTACFTHNSVSTLNDDSPFNWFKYL